MPSEESSLEAERRSKIERLRSRRIEPYPHSFPGRVPTREVAAAASRLAVGEESAQAEYRVAGRLRSVRTHGRASFADLVDQSGTLQLVLRSDVLGDEAYAAWLSDLDPGDIIGAIGYAGRTRRGENSLVARSLVLLAKAISPPPEKYHGLKDEEQRIRRRYLDLLASEDVRRRFRLRSEIVQEVRRAFDAAGFLEVETPILLPVASGAAAAPFVTHSRYLDEELQLRIAIELSLKRLLVGGLERVYEIGRCFRNEDLDATHSPEFTMLEAYWAYADYHDLRRLLEDLFERVAARTQELMPNVPEVRAATDRFRPPFPTLDFVESLEQASGISRVADLSVDELRLRARAIGATVPDDSPPGIFLDKLFEHYVEPTIDHVSFVIDHPASTTPLAKRHRSKAGRVERFEVFCRSFELGNAYTELNDPDEQERRFREQLSARGEDTYAYDADFVAAMRYGMPPATGIGIGIDRLVMALLGATSIKDILLFPQTRAHSG
ncbi:MAG: lysine--tRNA ligase [Thermoplasmatales archaeon]|nr:lysine--tRNA ligase [Thermoplasmatales archaeon]